MEYFLYGILIILNEYYYPFWIGRGDHLVYYERDLCYQSFECSSPDDEAGRAGRYVLRRLAS